MHQARSRIEAVIALALGTVRSSNGFGGGASGGGRGAGG